MKKIKILLCTILFLGLNLNMLFAQAIISNGKLFHEKKEIPAKEMAVTGSPDDVLSNFKTFLAKNYKAKTKSKKNMLEGKAVTLKGVLEKTGDILVSFDQVGESTLIKFAYALGYDIYLNENDYPEDFQKLNLVLDRFYLFQEIAILEAKIKEQKSLLKTKNEQISAEQRTLNNSEKQLKAMKKNPAADKSEMDLIAQKMQSSKDLVKLQKSASDEIKALIKSYEKDIEKIKAKLK